MSEKRHDHYTDRPWDEIEDRTDAWWIDSNIKDRRYSDGSGEIIAYTSGECTQEQADLLTNAPRWRRAYRILRDEVRRLRGKERQRRERAKYLYQLFPDLIKIEEGIDKYVTPKPDNETEG